MFNIRGKGLLETLRDPKYHTAWELWYYSIVGSCRIYSIKSMTSARTTRVKARRFPIQGLGVNYGSGSGLQIWDLDISRVSDWLMVITRDPKMVS